MKNQIAPTSTPAVHSVADYFFCEGGRFLFPLCFSPAESSALCRVADNRVENEGSSETVFNMLRGLSFGLCFLCMGLWGISVEQSIQTK